MSDAPSKESLDAAQGVVDKLSNQLFGTGLDRVKVRHEIAVAMDAIRRERDEAAEKLAEALEKIVNTIAWLADDARKQGAKLDGAMAIKLASDPEYLKEIARDALAAWREREGRR